QYAIKRRMVDVPNARSSHRVATPRGGGGAIVVATTVARAWSLWASGSMALAGVLVGGLVVAGIGFVDDHHPVPASIRLVGHTLAAALAVLVLGVPGIAVALLAVVFIAWLINLTNFMDGIDGIAGVQTLTVGASGAVLSQMIVPGTGLWIEPAVLAAASIGFLIWNWPPARVFMGDVGSGYVGFMVAVLTLRAASVSPVLGWCWLILSGVFIVDATFTLARRTVRGDRLFQAHRSHAYQHLARTWGHRPVTLLVAAINVLWLMPVAVLVALGHVSGATGVVLAYLPLTVGAARFGAGSVSQS
ncbi:MAG: glycosyltransferase family 4 protein, partial [Candidatus Limnocylindria bacterium]